MRNVNVFMTRRILTPSWAYSDQFRLIICECRDISCLRKMHGKVWAVIDADLPETPGVQLSQALPTHLVGASVHVTLLVRDDDAASRKRALDVGIDDFLKPDVGPNELIAHLTKLKARIPDIGFDRHLVAGELLIDSQSYRVSWQGRSVAMGMRDFRLLRYFAMNQDRVVSYEELPHVMGIGPGPANRSVLRRAVSRLRQTLVASGVPCRFRPIDTEGYIFEPG